MEVTTLRLARSEVQVPQPTSVGPASEFERLSGNATDVSRFLELHLGPQRLPYNSLIPFTVVYCVIFMTGMVGNASTCLVILRNQYMQTATNFYLFNLAVADMLTLFIGKQFSYFFNDGAASCQSSLN